MQKFATIAVFYSEWICRCFGGSDFNFGDSCCQNGARYDNLHVSGVLFGREEYACFVS